MRNLLMIAAFAVFTACASQSDTDVGETTPQTDQGTVDPNVDANDTEETQGQRPDDGTPPNTDDTPTTTEPSTGYEPQPTTVDTMQQLPPADTGMGTDTMSTTPSTGTWGDTSSTTTSPSTGTWGDTSTTTSPGTGTTTDTMMTTAPDSL